MERVSQTGGEDANAPSQIIIAAAPAIPWRSTHVLESLLWIPSCSRRRQTSSRHVAAVSCANASFRSTKPSRMNASISRAVSGPPVAWRLALPWAAVALSNLLSPPLRKSGASASASERCCCCCLRRFPMPKSPKIWFAFPASPTPPGCNPRSRLSTNCAAFNWYTCLNQLRADIRIWKTGNTIEPNGRRLTPLAACDQNGIRKNNGRKKETSARACCLHPTAAAAAAAVGNEQGGADRRLTD